VFDIVFVITLLGLVEINHIYDNQKQQCHGGLGNREIPDQAMDNSCQGLHEIAIPEKWQDRKTDAFENIYKDEKVKHQVVSAIGHS